MLSKKILLAVLASTALQMSGYALATQVQTGNEPIAREASEGPRGGDNERPGDRQRRGGRAGAIDNPSEDILARRGADDPIRHPRGEGAGHPNSVDTSEMILARRGADDPVGSERPGEVHGQRRGGRNSAESMIIAREASEAPRGADNNNQRRRGRA